MIIDVNKYIFLFFFILVAVLHVFSEPVGRENKSTSAKPLNIDQFKLWMKNYSQNIPWTNREYDKMLTRQILLDSYDLGRQFIINNQKPAGNFTYEYDFIKKTETGKDNQVRQAGAVWALAVMFKYDRDPSTKKALDKALNFFFENTNRGSAKGSLVISYPGDDVCITNTVAIISLALIEYLHMNKQGMVNLNDEQENQLQKYLNGYLNYLKSARLENKHFSRQYIIKEKAFSQDFDPYADGETLLALVKAAKYLGYKELIPMIEESSIVMAKNYTYDQWIYNYDSPMTKGFFQWSCMAFWEYQDAGWKDSEFYREFILSVAWWMINVHKTLYRQANTSYVYEGIIPALLVARDLKKENAASDLEYTTDRALYKLTTWQVGGPLKFENFLLVNNPINDPKAVGGVMNYKDNPVLRIDVTQHQINSIIFALENIYN